MALVVAEMTMSLDGYIADPSDGVDELFGWYSDGPVTVRTRNPEMSFHVSEASAAHIRETMDGIGAILTGRRLYDLTNGWDGVHPLGGEVFLVTHRAPEDPPPGVTVITGGIEEAVAAASAAAGGGIVGVGGAATAQSCLEAGLLDEVRVNLVPVLLGEGIPYFSGPSTAPVRLGTPHRVIEGVGVTHLYYRAR
ncbi:dihydrofolate reductase family protein [Actinomadura livida]|uniref:Dihydrofolate reductase n=1 Tax=Actinomadura livida TaxID=79909 RepID=A0A7W7ICE0_9ACTN|nr:MULTISPECIES: dihydrofolate reductase family protein [Actinomadura]MBB4774519.1 dihydrofolate reductase [Actinomadura catellatispora]GGT81985.1 deaminase [Actinomadura livida]